MSILVVGSIALDTVRTQTEERIDILGGSCTYFAVAASHFSPVQVVGAVGEDFPVEHRELLESHNIDLAGLETKAGEKTFRWAGTYAENMNDRTTDDLQFGALGTFDPELPKSFRNARHVFLANDHPAHQLKVMDQLEGEAVIVCDTIDHYINTENELVLEVLKRVDGAILNDGEACLLTGVSNTVAAAKALCDLGLRFAVVKKGEHGAILVCDGAVYAVPAYPLDTVVDPTGAGDSFAGGFMGFLAESDASDATHLRTALAYGTALASSTCEGFSLDALHQIDRKQIEERVRAFREVALIP